MKKLLYVLTLCFFSSSVHAQLKVGANPGTISTNAVLDIEGSSGKHSIILQNGNMGVGTVTPSNQLHVNATNPLRLEGLQTGGTNILRVDGSGIVYQQAPADLVLPTYVVSLSSSNEVISPQAQRASLPFTSLTYATPSSAAADFTGGIWKAPRKGVYRIDLNANMVSQNNQASTIAQAQIFIVKNPGTSSQVDLWASTVALPTGGPSVAVGSGSTSFTTIAELNAGDTIGAAFSSCYGCGPNNYGTRERNLIINRLE